MTRQEQWIQLDHFRRKLFLKAYLKKSITKLLKVNKTSTHAQQIFYSLHSSAIVRQGAVAKIRNRCVKTGRSRHVLKKIASSRFIFRKFANTSRLPSISRYSR